MKTHRFDSLSFLVGLVVTIIGLVFLIPANPGDVFDAFGDIGTWFWPALFVAVGVAVLAPLAARVRDDDEEPEPEDHAV